MSLIEVNNAEVYYGPIRAVKGVSFRVERGEIVALIGANGAGKTTVLHAMSGLLPVRGGEIFYNGHNLLKMPAHKIVRLGLTQVPEGRRVFAELSVKDNLLLGAYTRKNKKEIKETLEYVFALFPRLLERVSQAAGTLSGGEQQMLAVGRALMSKPETLLLDEPSMGLAPMIVEEIFHGRHGAAGGTEREKSAFRRVAGVRAGNGQRRARRHGARASERPRDSGGIFRAAGFACFVTDGYICV